jgi:hypothetical protein
MADRILTLSKVPSKVAGTPAIVMGLAEKVHMTPIAWRVAPDSVTIVFEQGPKIQFDRASMADEPVRADPVSALPDSSVITLADGMNQTEATTAGKALAARPSSPKGRRSKKTPALSS